MELHLTDDFFSDDDNFEIQSGKIDAILTAEKSGTSVIVGLNFSGEVVVPCDRCLENVAVSVSGENVLSLRFVKNADEIDYDEDITEDVMYVNEDEGEIDLGEYVHESILLSLPLQRVHGKGKNGKSLCNPEMLKYISNQDTKEINSPFAILKDIDINS